MAARQSWTDWEILDILDLHERAGWTATQISKHYIEQGKNLTRSGVLGIIHRVRKAIDAVGNPDHLDGTMPPRWWDR